MYRAISVVIPAYNGERFLDKTIGSVCAQGCADWELLIIDDGSTDATGDIARAWEKRDDRIRYFRRNAPSGSACPARNEGYVRATPENAYILFLDQDDLLYPTALHHLRTTLERNTDAVAVHGLVDYLDADGRIFARQRADSRAELRGRRVVRLRPEEPTTFRTLATTNCIHTPGCVLVRRSALAGRKPFPDSDRSALDWDGWLSLTANGHMVQLSEVVLSYRKTSDSMSAQTGRMRERILLTRHRTARSHLFTAEQQRFILDALAPCELFQAEEKLVFAGGALRVGLPRDAIPQLVYCMGHIGRWIRYVAPGRPFVADGVDQLDESSSQNQVITDEDSARKGIR